MHAYKFGNSIWNEVLHFFLVLNYFILLDSISSIHFTFLYLYQVYLIEGGCPCRKIDISEVALARQIIYLLSLSSIIAPKWRVIIAISLNKTSSVITCMNINGATMVLCLYGDFLKDTILTWCYNKFPKVYRLLKFYHCSVKLFQNVSQILLMEEEEMSVNKFLFVLNVFLVLMWHRCWSKLKWVVSKQKDINFSLCGT